jgi:hypothetical protein
MPFFSRGDFHPRAQWCLELAKLHTALAQVAATAGAAEDREHRDQARDPDRDRAREAGLGGLVADSLLAWQSGTSSR